MEREKPFINSEIELIHSAQKDISRFNVLYELYFDRIYSYIRKVCGDPVIAEDLCADVFLSAMMNIKKFVPGPAGLKPWLYRIAFNRLNHYFRKGKGVYFLPVNEIVLEEIGVTETAIEQSERRRILESALSLLDSAEAGLITLRFTEGLSFKEISEITGLSEDAGKMRLHRIIQKLKGFIQAGK